MTDDKKKGIFSKLFGSKKSSCCNLKIEEVTEQDSPEQTPEPPKSSLCCAPCCGDTPAKRAKEQTRQQQSE
ncbi:MAG TPA: hypothetical protein PLU87_19865 [Sedimentisphaerales bacterium]|nr:hypothetical protein [Sedimentisphaerales bacterium]HRS13321.1 hypothetical protein [Sedimentisphaerales bacterium]HRV49968.1 hypothetical protein [Sedimentisphaerales bacterium]